MNNDAHILQSWHTNANAWINAIVNQEIESRRLVTNEAILQTIASLKPTSMLDIGCGEGWLCREAHSRIDSIHKVKGIDAVPELIHKARLSGTASFDVASYEDIIDGRFLFTETFDLIVFNFALFGNELVKNLLQKIRSHLSSQGRLVIQTIHPENIPEASVDGWLPGSWNGFSEKFTDPAPWYFRTMQGWRNLLADSGYSIESIREPLYPSGEKLASVIFVSQSA